MYSKLLLSDSIKNVPLRESTIDYAKVFRAENHPRLSSCLHSIFTSDYTFYQFLEAMGSSIMADKAFNSLGDYAHLSIADVFRSEWFSATPYDMLVDASPHPPADILALNKYWAENYKACHWHTIWNRIPLLPVVHDSNPEALVQPFMSLCLPHNVGSTIIFGYSIGDLLVCPVYSRLMVEFCGVLLADLHTAESALLASCCLASNLEADDFMMRSIVDSINLSLRALQSVKNSAVSTVPLERTLLAGMHYNYGHTIINDTLYIDPDFSLRPKADDPCTTVTLGLWDYVDSELVLMTQSANSLELRFRSLENDKLDYFFVSFQYYYCPLPSHRPSLRSLRSLSVACRKALGATYHGFHQFSSAAIQKTETLVKSIYIAVDQRQGCRQMLNAVDVFNIISEFARSRGLALIIDGLTSYPVYPVDVEGSHSRNYRFQPALKGCTDLLEIAKSMQVQAANLDGMTLQQKIGFMRSQDIWHAFTSYGSSSIIPIYLLNCRISIYGSSYLAKSTRSAWSWHISSLCHPQRVTQEFYLPSSSQGDAGYFVDIEFMRKFLEEL
ncbi:hypothetical protein [Synechococcus sp. MW101C3]|uniref:hypothetical protein n=1 Tax=Synechococcus sp. MW101C3 TaxID=210768 RepID=UPI001181B652|nr:hypothetical protein [Synechococcus sp. MW101C3]